MKIAFIGLGHMGAPMARNLHKAGHELVVFDIDKEAMRQFIIAGAESAACVYRREGGALESAERCPASRLEYHRSSYG